MQLIHKGAATALLLTAALLAGCGRGLSVQGTTNFDDLEVANLTVLGDLAVAGALTADGGPVSLDAGAVSLGDVTLAGNGTLISVRDAEQVVELGNTDAGVTLAVDAAAGRLLASDLAFTARRAVVAAAEGCALTNADTRAFVHNRGAEAAVTCSLPAAAAGLDFCFYVAAAQTLSVKPAAGDQIAVLTDAAGDRIAADAAGRSVCLVALDDAVWAVYATTGAWADAD
ncbi:MAG: hypothetical protein BWY52_01956 [Chloroflexi bacterium ADurb.Bin325]|nr:MAG: hypothetical protein BWY52_01956 [Chloroflexi bacterium ADurb.Bin325]